MRRIVWDGYMLWERRGDVIPFIGEMPVYFWDRPAFGGHRVSTFRPVTSLLQCGCGGSIGCGAVAEQGQSGGKKGVEPSVFLDGRRCAMLVWSCGWCAVLHAAAGMPTRAANARAATVGGASRPHAVYRSPQGEALFHARCAARSGLLWEGDDVARGFEVHDGRDPVAVPMPDGGAACPSCDVVRSLVGGRAAETQPGATVAYADEEVVVMVLRQPQRAPVVVLPCRHVAGLAELPSPTLGRLLAALRRICVWAEERCLVPRARLEETRGDPASEGHVGFRVVPATSRRAGVPC